MDPETQKLRWPDALMRALTVRRVIGLLICSAGCLLLLGSLIDQLINSNPKMHAALIGGAIAAAATGLGTLPVLFSQNFSKRTYDGFLGFGAGVMLGATAFSLVIPAIAAARSSGADSWEASLLAGVGIMGGAGAILFMGRAIEPAEVLEKSASASSLRRAWLFVTAVALHNMPEGMAIGVAYAGIDLDKANSLMTGISIQDVPEGLVVALALRTVGYSRLVSVGLGAAGGAMLFVIVHDVIPEMRENGNGTSATIALIFGFILMTVLDTALA
jgi:ZIP family zinc transporter